MKADKLEIVVLLRESSDPHPPARTGVNGAFIDERGLRRMANPSDLSALEEALILKDRLSAKVIALSIGPKRVDDLLRLAMAMGADKAIRAWNHGMEGADAISESRSLARVISILSPDFLFTGNILLDRGDDPAPLLASAMLNQPAVTAVNEFTLGKNNIAALRSSDRGAKQKVSAPLPCTLLFEEGRFPRYPSVDEVTNSLTEEIEVWGLADLGLPLSQIGYAGALLSDSSYTIPRPDPLRLVTPDPDLPAFDRILSLLSGGIKARAGKINNLSVDKTVDSLLGIFNEEGILKGTSR